jgi:hypothetical protein
VADQVTHLKQLAESPQPDITFVDHGSVVLVTGHSKAAKEHLADRMPDDAQRWGGGYVVEPRYVDLIVEDVLSHDFTVGMS